MTRNRRKMIKKTADSLLLSKHSIQFSALFLLLSAANFRTVQKKLELNYHSSTYLALKGAIIILEIVFDFDPQVLSFKTTISQGLSSSWNSSQLSTWVHKCHYSHNSHCCFCLHFIKHNHSASYWSKVLWSFGSTHK